MAFMDDDKIRRAQRLAFLARSGAPDIFMPGAPPPAQATPSTPLPGTPMDRAVVAPQSESAVNPQYDELGPIRALLQPRQIAPTGVKEIDARLAQTAAAQQGGAQNFLNLLSGVQMDPRELAILEARRLKAKEQAEEVGAEQKRAGWDALARAGLAMAKSNSPYFMQALASGMEAGLQGLDEAELKAAEKRSRLQAAEEDAILAQIRGRQSAQDRAVSVYNAAIAAGKSESEARDQAIKSAITAETLPQQLEMAKLEVEGKRLDNKLTEARTVDALRGPRGGSSRDGGDGTPGPRPLPPGARAEAQGRLATAYSEQDEAYRDWVAAGKPLIGKVKEGTDEWSAASAYEAARGKVNNILKILGEPSLGPAPTRTGGQRITQAQRRAAAPRPAARPASSGSSLKKGDVVNGYRYKGGDPNDKKNWTKA